MIIVGRQNWVAYTHRLRFLDVFSVFGFGLFLPYTSSTRDLEKGRVYVATQKI